MAVETQPLRRNTIRKTIAGAAALTGLMAVGGGAIGVVGGIGSDVVSNIRHGDSSERAQRKFPVDEKAKAKAQASLDGFHQQLDTALARDNPSSIQGLITPDRIKVLVSAERQIQAADVQERKQQAESDRLYTKEGQGIARGPEIGAGIGALAGVGTVINLVFRSRKQRRI